MIQPLLAVWCVLCSTYVSSALSGTTFADSYLLIMVSSPLIFLYFFVAVPAYETFFGALASMVDSFYELFIAVIFFSLYFLVGV